jgi:GNAT superfamily N-acetyltransferase
MLVFIQTCTFRVEIIGLIKYKHNYSEVLHMTQPVYVTIRHANSDDANTLADLGARTFQETFAADNTEEDMAVYLTSHFSVAQQTSELAHPASTFLIAEVDGQAAGYAKLHAGEPPEEIEGAKPIELVRLYVLQEWLGRSIGQELMRACFDEARNTGHETLWLGVWERNARARAFYNKWDFRAVGEHIFQLGSDAQRDILMERAL